jgi:hypothetical protein
VQALRLTLGGYWGDNISQSIDNIVRILYSSADVIVPRIASSGQQRLGIIQVRALLSLESLLRANSTLVLFECRRYCPSNRFIGPATPWYYSSAGALVPRIASSGLQHLGIIRVWAILSLEAHCSYSSSADALSFESLHQAFSASIFFEYGLLSPSNLYFGLSMLSSYLSRNMVAINRFGCHMSNTKVSPQLSTLDGPVYVSITLF